MLEMRVISGLHAGSTALLSPGIFSISRGGLEALPEHTDIAPHESRRISNNKIRHLTFFDWIAPDIFFEVTDEDLVLIISNAADPHRSQAKVWPLHVLQNFSGVALCISKLSHPWSNTVSDGIKSKTNRVPVRVFMRQLRASAIFCLLVGLIYAAFCFVKPTRHDVKAGSITRSGTAIAFDRLKERFREAEFLDLVLSRQLDNQIVIAGLVPTSKDGDVMRNILSEIEAQNNISKQNVLQYWLVADEVATLLANGIRNPDVVVSYAGKRRFELHGSVLKLEDVISKVEAVKIDVGENVSEIASFLTQKQANAAAMVAMVNADGFKYLERIDGAKSFKPMTP